MNFCCNLRFDGGDLRMPDIRIPEYFPTITARVTYPSPMQESSGENVFLLPGEGVVTTGRYETVELSDNAALIDELVKIHADIKSARPCASTWSGINGCQDHLSTYPMKCYNQRP